MKLKNCNLTDKYREIMSKKKEVLDAIGYFAENTEDQAGVKGDVVWHTDFEALAEKIDKLYSLPVVSFDLPNRKQLEELQKIGSEFIFETYDDKQFISQKGIEKIFVEYLKMSKAACF